MKLKVVPKRRLVAQPRTAPEKQLYQPSDAPIGEKREALYRAIERTQAFMHKKEPTDGLMADIRTRYPAPVYFIESNRQALERFGLSRLDAFYYAMIPALTRTSLSQQWGERPFLGALDSVGPYLKTLYVGVHVECFYVLLLDRQGRLIRPVLLQKGGVDYAPFYLAQLIAVALQESARFIVLAHNHPGGTKKPSKEDLKCTLKAISAFAPLRVPLLDHVIVAGDEVVSIRQAGLLPAMLWTAASPGSRIVNQWLDDKT